jgi:hypothetical protein
MKLQAPISKLLILMVVMAATKSQLLLDKAEWSITSQNNDGLWAKVEFPKLKDQETAIRYESVRYFKPSDLLVMNSEGNLQETIEVEEIAVPEGLAKHGKNGPAVLVKFNYLQSHDSFDARIYLKQPTTPVARVLQNRRELLESDQYNAVTFRAQWKLKTDWEDVSFTVFKWVKRLVMILQLYIIFFRPILNSTHKLPVAWMASTVMSFQTLFFMPYILGNFGGIIDKVNYGLAKAGFDTFGCNLTATYLSPHFEFLTETLFFSKMHPKIVPFIPNPLLNNLVHVFMLGFGCMFPFFSMAMRNRNLARIAKGMKSSMILVFAVPLTTNSVCNIIQFFLVLKNVKAFEIASVFVSLLILVLYFFELKWMFRPAGYDAFYVNNEEGLADFDCHPRTRTSLLVRRGEIWISMLLPIATWCLSLTKIFSPIVIFLIYIVLFGVTLQRGKLNLWRDDVSDVNDLKVMELLNRLGMLTVMLIFWIFKNLKLRAIKWLTWVYLLLLLFVLLFNIGVLLERIYFETDKVFDWNNIDENYPENPRMLMSSEKALAAIGKGKGQRRQVRVNAIPRDQVAFENELPKNKVMPMMNEANDGDQTPQASELEEKPDENTPIVAKSVGKDGLKDGKLK